MTYRNPPAPIPHLCGVTSEASLHVLNGTITEFAIPCSYVKPVEGSDTETVTVPIHLVAEGYSAPVIAIGGGPAGLTGNAWIDEVDDSIVRFTIAAQCPDAVAEDVTCDIAILITRTTPLHGDRTDAVVRGPLTIEASPLAGEAPSLPAISPFTTADHVAVDTTGFTGLLTAADDTVQKALATLQIALDPATASELAPGIVTLESLSAALQELLVPVGEIKMIAHANADPGYLLCDGQEASRVEDAALYAKLGGAASPWGQGDGSTTFNVPDFRSRSPIGAGAGVGEGASGTGLPDGAALTARLLGAWGGKEKHALALSEIPSHTHPIATFLNAHQMLQGTGATIGNYFWNATQATATGSAGTGGTHPNVPPFTAVNFMIKR